MWNLLTDSVLSIGLAGATRVCTLPELFAALFADEVEDLPALRPHQEHAWYAFLVQVAAMVAHRAGSDPAMWGVDAWREHLRELGGGDDAWTLVVDDCERTAFFQNPSTTPLPETANEAHAPDLIDILATAKAHDVKRSRMAAARPEHWAYALCTLQTMQGFGGAGNYGVARMNSGFGTRTAVSVTTSLRWGARLRRDVALLAEHRAFVVEEHGYAGEGGHALLWTLTWDGDRIVAANADCDPWFVEACRRIRLVRRGEGVVARYVASKTGLHAGTGKSGDTGDPWLPLKTDKDGQKGLNLSGAGFTTKLTLALLTAGRRGDNTDLVAPAAMSLNGLAPGSALVLTAAALARGQGKTDGFHERLLPVPAPGARRLRTEAVRVRTRAATRLELAERIRSKVLYPALKEVVPDRELARFTGPFADEVDRIFFTELWAALEASDDRAADLAWVMRLGELARQQLEQAITTAPLPSSTRWQRMSAADGKFGALLHRQLAALTEGASP